jgi:DNA-binding SARP family transcriptional activator
VLFEVWRSAEHVVGRGGEADPLYGYLSSDILGQLAEEDCEFLVSTSLLDEVTAAGAETLGLKGAGERLVALRAAHLPVAWSADGHAMRCHSRFREYLVERLERRGYEAVRELRLAYARHLAAEGLDEDAAEEFLRADDPAEALPLAESAIGRVIERGDFAIADRWLQALADLAPAGASPLTVAELMLGAAREDLRSVVRIADQLEALGERDELAATSDAATWLMVWGYISLIRPDDVLAVLDAAEPGPVVDAARYATQVMLDAAGGPLARPALTGGPVDAFVFIADYALGHLGELTAESESRWAELVKGQWRIAALRATGQTERALELYEASTGPETLSLQTWIGPELLLDAGRIEEARTMVVEGRRTSRESGSAASQGMNALAEAKLRLRGDRDPAAAREVLDRPEIRRVTSVFGYIREVADAWYALALLWQGEDEAALARLRSAIAGMTGGARELELPTAAVYLAEAEWRAGDEAAADRAADLALDAARRQGSKHLLLQALADFPAVASRRIDAESGADSPWHEVGRALIAQGVALAATVRASIELREFGQRAIVVNGEGVKPRIAKTYEVLAVLAARRPAQARRDELLEALFGGRSDDSARAYLRQAVHWLRQTLPEGAILVEDGVIRLSEGIEIDAESVRFERRLAEAARLQDAQRLGATLAALEIYDRGDYLPGLRSAWADERHAELADLASGARYEAAELAFAAADYEQARALVDTALAADPFREAAWRLLMRIAEPLGDEKGVLRAYHGCERALGRLGTTPSPSTRQLLESLRR